MESPTIRLLGATDEKSSRLDSKAKQYMQIDLDQDVLEELVSYYKRGKAPQVVLGRNPVLRYGDKTHVLETREAPFRQELYRSSESGSDKENEWDFEGVVGHVMTLRRAEQASKDLDIALEALKHSMETIKQEGEAKRTLITPELHGVRGSKLHRQSPHITSNQRPQQSSPSISKSSTQNSRSTQNNKLGDNSPSPNMGFIENLQEADAIRYALRHLLAIKGSCTLDEAAEKMNARRALVKYALEGVADLKDKELYSMRKKSYKDLDVWEFPYPNEEDRQSAIENAIHAFDQLRIDAHDDIWQNLLSPSERGKGKTLSKLKLKPPTATTPLMKSSIVSSKTGLPKKTAEPKKDKPTSIGENKPTEKVKADKPIDAKKKDTAPRTPASGQKEKPATTAAREHGRYDSDSNRNNASKRKPAGKTLPPKDKAAILKEDRPSTAAKALLNKPKNPSPLSQSPPVNASDFEQHHPVHKVLTRVPSPKKNDLQATLKSLKRKSDEHDRRDRDRDERVIKKHKLDGSAGGSGTPASKSGSVKPISKPVNGTSGGTKRKVDNDSSSSEDTPLALKVRKLKSGDGVRTPSQGGSSSHSRVNVHSHSNSHSANTKVITSSSKAASHSRSVNGHSNSQSKTNGHGHTSGISRRKESSGSSGSDNTPGLSLSWRQSVDLASRFTKYYQRYVQMYHEVNRPDTTKEKHDEFMRMHNMLADIKKQLNGCDSLD